MSLLDFPYSMLYIRTCADIGSRIYVRCNTWSNNSFVDLFDDEGNYIPEHQTDHEWTGTLILPKKNK